MRKLKKFLIYSGSVLSVLLFTLASLLFFSVEWMFDTWQHLRMEELIYHLKAPLSGTNGEMIEDYLSVCAVPTVLICIFVIILLIGYRKKRIYNVLLCTIVAVSAGILLGIGIYTWGELGVGSYLKNRGKVSSFIDDNYVDPQYVEITFPEQKRNLIYIYLESMETTYSDYENGGAFETNYIPGLTDLAEMYENFSGDENRLNGGYAMNNTTWTMGAMFGHSTGLPLTIPIDGSNMDSQDSFFPGIIAIGDILEDAGYQNSLLIGSKAVFGGRKLFYEEHGNYQIFDWEYSNRHGEIPKDYYVWWGYEDNILFKNAKKRLMELSKADQPFNLTMLTVDTHFPDGYYCADCKEIYGNNQYANVIACSDRQVVKFVQWIQRQDFYDNTTIVITGDHPTMDADFCDSVDHEYVRKVYTTYINAIQDPQIHEYREYATFDLFPTTLAALGAAIDGNRLGLGTNLFSEERTLTELYGRDRENLEILGKSELMDKLASEVNQHPTRLSEQEKMLQKQKELNESNELESLSITVSPYDYETGYFEVHIPALPDKEEGSSYTCAVWPADDQSKCKWYPVEWMNDGDYIARIYAIDFAYIPGIYPVHVYEIKTDGTQILRGTIKGEITE